MSGWKKRGRVDWRIRRGRTSAHKNFSRGYHFDMTIDNFFVQLAEYWVVLRSVQRNTNVHTSAPERENVAYVLRALWRARKSIAQGRYAPMLFIPEQQALVLESVALNNLVENDVVRPFRMFYAKSVFWRRIRTFARGDVYERWREGVMPELKPVQNLILAFEAEGLPIAPAPLFKGTLVQGPIRDGATVIGFKNLSPREAREFGEVGMHGDFEVPSLAAASVVLPGIDEPSNVTNDDESLRRLLEVEDWDGRESHPALMGASDARVLHVVGKPGSGKSTAIYDIAREHLRHGPVLVIPADARYDSTLLHNVQSLKQQVLVLLDDLHVFAERPSAQWEFASLLARCSAEVRFVLATQGTERESVRRAFGRVLLRHEVIEIDLDNADRYAMENFFANVIWRRSATLDIAMTDGEVMTRARTWVADGVAVRDIESRLLALAGAEVRVAGSEYWHGRFIELLRDERRAQVDVLQALSFLRLAGAAVMPRYLVQALAGGASGWSAEEVDRALTVLRSDGWIREWREEVYSDSVQLAPKVTQLVRDGKPTAAYRRIVGWLIPNLPRVAHDNDRRWLSLHVQTCIAEWQDTTLVLAEEACGEEVGTERLDSESDPELWRDAIRCLGEQGELRGETLIALWPHAHEDPVVLVGIFEECGQHGWFDAAEGLLEWLFFQRPSSVAVSLLEMMILRDGTEMIVDEVIRGLRERGRVSDELESRVATVEALLRGQEDAQALDLLAIIEDSVRRGALAYAQFLTENIDTGLFETIERRRFESLREIVRTAGSNVSRAKQLFARLHE